MRAKAELICKNPGARKRGRKGGCPHSDAGYRSSQPRGRDALEIEVDAEGSVQLLRLRPATSWSWISIPQAGREQAKRRPALVLTDMRYNRASGLAVVCPVTIEKVEGAILVNQLKSLDWAGRNAKFHSKVATKTLATVRQFVGVLLSIPAVQRN